MGTYLVEAVVLRSRSYGEADAILTLYSRERGKIQAIAKGVRKIKSRKRAGVQLLSHGKFLLYEGKSLDTITQCEVTTSFAFLQEDLVKLAYATYLAELLEAFIVEGEGSDPLFFLFITTLNLLVEHDADILVRAFELRLMSLLGYRPVLEQCASCNAPFSGEIRFSSELGGAICSACFGKDIYANKCTRGTVEIMKLLLKQEFRKLNILKTNRQSKEELTKILRGYILARSEKNLKTLSFLDLVDSQ